MIERTPIQIRLVAPKTKGLDDIRRYTDDLPARVKPFRVLRKRLATLCLFLVIVTIILGMQVYGRFSAGLTVALIALAGLFAWRVNKSLIRFGWIV